MRTGDGCVNAIGRARSAQCDGLGQRGVAKSQEWVSGGRRKVAGVGPSDKGTVSVGGGWERVVTWCRHCCHILLFAVFALCRYCRYGERRLAVIRKPQWLAGGCERRGCLARMWKAEGRRFVNECD